MDDPYKQYMEQYRYIRAANGREIQEAFGHAQSVALTAQRTLIYLNAGGLGALATAYATNPDLLLTAIGIFHLGSFFLLGTIFALASCYVSYFNLIGHKEFFENELTIELYGMEEIYTQLAPNPEKERERIDREIKKAKKERIKINKKINCTFWIALGLTVLAFCAFVCGCFRVATIF